MSQPFNHALPLIGGSFGLEPAGSGGLAKHWNISANLAWENASSAFAALVRQLSPGAVWMPGYLCAHFATGIAHQILRIYTTTPDFEPDPASLAGLAKGDLVLGVNYFGRAPGPAWRDFVAAHSEVWFTEDCAQTLDSDGAPWGDWRIYSPRKLFGVPEGGLLVPVTPRAHERAISGPRLPADPKGAALRHRPMALRAEEPSNNALWFPMFRAAESSGTVSDRAMDPAAYGLLTSIDPAPMGAARRANFAALGQKLSRHALFPGANPPFAPFGFPVRLPAEVRDDVLSRMYRFGIFPAIHWRGILAPPGDGHEHALANSLATLPCDHRYVVQDMDRLATVFEECLP